MSGAGTTEEATLSAECTVGKQPGYGYVHDMCRQTEDIPVHHSAPRILLQRRCRCICHRPRRAVDPS